jgi:hypothetical protein
VDKKVSIQGLMEDGKELMILKELSGYTSKFYASL